MWAGDGIWLAQAVADAFCALLSYVVIYFFFTRVFHQKDSLVSTR
jgi:hypothetical protein